MKKITTLSILLLATKLVFAQLSVDKTSISTIDTLHNLNSESANNHQLHLEGSLILQSINFETKLSKSTLLSNSFQLNARLGIGYFKIDFFGVTESIGGIGTLVFLFGKNDHHFEATLGAFFGSDDGNSYGWPIGLLGYRYQKPTGGLIFRVNAGTLGLGFGLGHAF